MKSLNVFLMCCFVLFASSLSAKQTDTVNNVTITKNSDGSITFGGINKTVYLDADGNETTREALDLFLETSDIYTRGLRVDTKTGLQEIYARKWRAYDDEVIGKHLPSLDGRDINNREVKIIDNESVSLLCFWEKSCGSCIAEITALNYIAREFPDIKIIAITPNSSEATRKFMADKGITWKNLIVVPDYKGEYTQIIQSDTYPTSVLVSKEGVIKKISYGKLRPLIVAMDELSVVTK